MEVIQEIRSALSGYKSYGVGGLMMLVGWYQKNPNLVLQGLSVVCLRAGLNKVSK